VVAGICFIGGGAILKKDDQVLGTASAASIWATGAIGIAVAYARYDIALIPVSDSQDVPQNWYLIWYYVVLVGTAVLSGSLISVVMMLYNAVKGLIRALHPREESQLVKNKSQGA
jgi:hypothetical protein